MSKPNWRCGQAKLVLAADAPREEWLAARTQGVGGSDVATITGANTFKTPFELWQTKTSDEPPVDEDKDILWYGHAVEPLLAERFTKDTGVATRRVGMYARRMTPWAFANPDRLTADGGILEIKSTGWYTDRAKKWQAGEVPDDAYVQAQWYLHVTGRSHAWFIALVDRTPHIVGPVPRDEDLIVSLHQQAEMFWEHVEQKTPPPLDLARIGEDEITQRFPEVIEPGECAEAPIPEAAADDIREYARLKALEKETKASLDAVKDRIQGLIGEREYLTIDGRPVARWAQRAGRRTFDKKAAAEKIAADRGLEPTKHNIDQIIDEFTKQGTPYRVLTLMTGDAA